MGGQIYVANFFGESVKIKPELREYVGYCAQLEKIRLRLLNKFYSERVKGEIPEFAPKILNEFKKEAEKFVALLAKNDILNVTINDIVDTNEGYKRYEADSIEASKIIIDTVNRYNDAAQRGIAIERQKAYDKVSGSGTMLFSNSMAAHVAYSLVESGVMYGQAAQAQKKYNDNIKNFAEATLNAFEAEVKSFADNVWYPKVIDSIGLFTYGLLDLYLSELHKRGTFNYDIVKAYNVERSQQLLNNLKVVDNKRGVLIEAFKACPINGLIYQECFNNKLLTIDIYETANYLGMSNGLDELISKTLEQAGQKPLTHKQYLNADYFLPLASRALNMPIEDVTKQYFQNSVSNIEQKYSIIKRCLSNQKELHNFLKANVNKQMSQLVKLDSDAIKSAIQKYLNNIVSNDSFGVLVSNHAIETHSEIFIGNIKTNDLSAINTQWENALMEATSKFIVEAKRRLSNYEQAKEKYKASESSLTSCDICLLTFAFKKL
jgi:hypothetical protein